jgi:hypothetical protein
VRRAVPSLRTTPRCGHVIAAILSRFRELPLPPCVARHTQGRDEMALRDNTNGEEPTFSTVQESLSREGARLAADLKEDARRFALDKRDAAAGLLSDVGEAVSVASDEMRRRGRDRVAGYADSAAREMERVADGLAHRELGDELSEVEDFARRRPGLFYGFALLAGFAAIRFLRSRGDGAA